MFTDELRHDVWEKVRQCDCRAFQQFLQPEVFHAAAERANVPLGSSALSKGTLVWLGILTALHQTRSFATVLLLTFQLVQDLADSVSKPAPPANRHGRQDQTRRKPKARRHTAPRQRRSKHHPRPEGRTAVSEEAFVKARRRMPLAFWMALIAVLGERFEAAHGPLVRWKHFRLLALDGTTVTLPRVPALGTAFGTAKSGRSAGPPQARLVMLQLPLTRLPVRYELCPLDEGERTIAARLLGALRAGDLLLMDRGFWSYGLFHQLQQTQAFFAIRRHAQARLQTLRRLGPQDHLVRWTKPSGPRWRGSQWPPQLELRIIDYQIRGFRPSAVVTNVLDPGVVSRDEWVHMATETDPGRRIDQGLYHRRWEIETSFYELKALQGLERSLRSKTPEGVQFEVAGQIVLYLLVRWLMVEAAVQESVREGRRIEPLRLSFRHAIEELIELRPLLLDATPSHAMQVLLPLLLKRLGRHLVPYRPGRHYSRPGDTRVKNTGRGSKRKLPHKISKTVT